VLGEEADFDAQNCHPALNLIRSTKLHLSTKPTFLPSCCQMFYFFNLFFLIIYKLLFWVMLFGIIPAIAAGMFLGYFVKIK